MKRSPAGLVLHALQRDGRAVAEVIDEGDVVVGRRQNDAGVASDMPAPPVRRMFIDVRIAPETRSCGLRA